MATAKDRQEPQKPEEASSECRHHHVTKPQRKPLEEASGGSVASVPGWAVL